MNLSLAHSVFITLLGSLSLLCPSCSQRADFPERLDQKGIFIPPKKHASYQLGTYAPLVPLQQVDATIATKLRYATKQNFTKRVLYPENFPALLRPRTAARLSYANRLVEEHGYRILVWDAYRPRSVQLKLWEAAGRNPTFVADPHKHNSLHTMGCAVDVTLALPDGTPALLPTDFDHFGPRAATAYKHPNPIVRENLRILKDAMNRAGFAAINDEWWHFLDKDFRDYRDIPQLEHLLGNAR